MAYCSKCGAQLKEGAKFCPKCGKPVSQDNSSADCDNVEVQANEIDRPEEYGNIVGNEIKTRRNKVPLGISIVVIIFIMGTIMWNYYSSKQREEREIAYADSLEQARKDSLEQVRLMEIARQDSINKVQQEEKEFLEKFYKNLWKLYKNMEEFNRDDDWVKLDSYIRKNVTSKALQTLRDAYEYDCEDGDCLVFWMFLYQGGTDCTEDNVIRQDISRVKPSTYLVSITRKYGDNDTCEYRVRIGLAKDGDTYKIDTIVNVEKEERQKAYNEINQYSKYVGKWRLRKRTGEGQMVVEIVLKENHSGELATFNDRGNVTDIILYEQYPLCILEDGVIYMTKNGDINGKGVPKVRVASDGLYSFDGENKYIRQSE